MPPLRHHVEDIQALVPFFVARLGYGGQLACSPEVLQMLMRSNWPGNVEQLLPDDAPRSCITGAPARSSRATCRPEIRSVSRRLLSPLESMERDAIVQSLAGRPRQQGEGGEVAGHVPGDDLPQDPRVRDRHPAPLDPFQ